MPGVFASIGSSEIRMPVIFAGRQTSAGCSAQTAGIGDFTDPAACFLLPEIVPNTPKQWYVNGFCNGFQFESLVFS